MIRYQVRSKELIDVVNELTSKRLIKSPYFQRNLVWRLIHKVDFIRTILKGLPFPQIFIAKGEIDVESMTTHSCVVDGQQRLTAIQQFVAGDFDVDGLEFRSMEKQAKEDFLKYQVPIIDLDIKQDDELLKEIFRRLNRTFYSLSAIERLATEYAASELMLLAKAMTDELFYVRGAEDDNVRELDPLISPEIIAKAKSLDLEKFQSLILDTGAFSNYEIARKVHLSFVLNVVATCVSGWYNRNSGFTRLLDSEQVSFDEYSAVGQDLNTVAGAILKLRLKSTSYWMNKANLFSLIIVIYRNLNRLSEVKPSEVTRRLVALEGGLPPAYVDAAKEAVNNKRERMLRHETLEVAIFGSTKSEKAKVRNTLGGSKPKSVAKSAAKKVVRKRHALLE